MSWLRTILILLVALLAVFAEATWELPRRATGSQASLLPSLIVYASLTGEISTLSLLSVVAGLWTDSLSANPPGVSILPLFMVGLFLRRWRDLILRDMPYAQSVLGASSAITVTLLTLLILMTVGERPLIGWGTVWQFVVVGVVGAGATPVAFFALDRLASWFEYQSIPTQSFRADREIKRGRQ